MFYELFFEKVSPDCSTGAGVAPVKVNGWSIIRTSHLDDKRGDSTRDRDYGFECDTFEELVEKFLNSRKNNPPSGDYSITWITKKGYQNMIVSVDAENKKMTFVTIIALNKKTADYRSMKPRQNKVIIGSVPVP
jgi:hypothetical protein